MVQPMGRAWEMFTWHSSPPPGAFCCPQAHCDEEGLPVAAAERYQLLSSFCQLLPNPVVSAHGAGIMGRRHVEVLPQRVLQQVG